LSQDALAAKASTTQRWVSELERGKTTVEMGLVLRALDCLGVELDARAPGHKGVSAPRADDDAWPDINAIVDGERS
jgi:transcriptional regulator with XRE-family HTH domain